MVYQCGQAGENGLTVASSVAKVVAEGTNDVPAARATPPVMVTKKRGKFATTAVVQVNNIFFLYINVCKKRSPSTILCKDIEGPI